MHQLPELAVDEFQICGFGRNEKWQSLQRGEQNNQSKFKLQMQGKTPYLKLECPLGWEAFVPRKPVHMTAPPTNGESTTTMWQPAIPVKVKRRRGGATKLRLRPGREGGRGREGGGTHRAYLCLAAPLPSLPWQQSGGGSLAWRTWKGRTRQKGSGNSGG